MIAAVNGCISSAGFLVHAGGVAANVSMQLLV